MNYNSELQSNNADLQEILAAVHALPEAGGGGSEVIPNTCKISFSAPAGRLIGYAAQCYDGEIKHIAALASGGMIYSPIENVVCGSMFVLFAQVYNGDFACSDNVSIVADANNYGIVLLAPNKAGATGTIEVGTQMGGGGA